MINWLVENQKWIYNNIQWIFSGIGVLFVSLLLAKLFKEKKNETRINFSFPRNDEIDNKRNATHIVDVHSKSPIPLQLPLQVDHFTGREKELKKLLKDLQPGKRITLCGPGGIGKSALASQAIWALALDNKSSTRFPDGIIWHDFYKEPQSIKALESIAISFKEDPRPSPIKAAQRALSGKQALILLDGAEDADDLPLILNLLGNCCALVTTRKKQDAGAQRDDMKSLSTNEAVKLFQAWSKKEDDTKSVQRICKLTCGLPLAVRLAGKYIFETGEPVSEYLEDLEKTPLETLNHGARKLESVPVLLNRSLNNVSDDAKSILGIVGILAFSPFSKEVIQSAITEININKTINELINYGLLNRTDNNRFIISHALIHKYARANHRPDNDDVGKIADYYNSYAKKHDEQGLKGYVLLNQERTHIMRVIEECKTREIWQRVNDLVWAAEDYLDMCGYWTDRVIALESGVIAAKNLKDRQDEGGHLGNLGNAYSDLGKIEKAIQYYEKALSISREIGNRKNEGIWLGNLGLAYIDLGKIEKAIEFNEQSLSISREIGHRHGEGIYLGNLGLAYIDLGKIEKAIEFNEQALSISREIGHRQGESSYLSNLGNAYIDLGKIEKAFEYYEQSLFISREIGHRQCEGLRLCNLGDAYRDLGKREKAIEYYEQALFISKEIGYRQGEGIRLSRLGDAYRDLGKIEKAIEYYQESITIYKEIKSPNTELYISLLNILKTSQ